MKSIVPGGVGAVGGGGVTSNGTHFGSVGGGLPGFSGFVRFLKCELLGRRA